jgi:hypothetical protein
MAVGFRCADHATPLYPQKLTLTSPISSDRSVVKVRSRLMLRSLVSLAVSYGCNQSWDCTVSRRPQSKQEEFCFVGSIAMSFDDESQPAFRRNMLHPSSGSTNKPRQNRRKARGKQSEMVVSLLAYSLGVITR